MVFLVLIYLTFTVKCDNILYRTSPPQGVSMVDMNTSEEENFLARIADSAAAWIQNGENREDAIRFAVTHHNKMGYKEELAIKVRNVLMARSKKARRSKADQNNKSHSYQQQPVFPRLGSNASQEGWIERLERKQIESEDSQQDS